MVRILKRPLGFLSKEIIITSCVLWTGAILLFLVYHCCGAALVEDIYHERSFWFLNDIFAGRDEHSIEFYHAKSHRLVSATIKVILLISLIPPFFAYAVHSRRTIPKVCISTDITLRTAALGFFSILLLSLIPFSFVKYPPLVDYPFHIARAYILNTWSDSPSLQDWYEIQSFILPNMGMDLSLLLIGKFLPIETAGLVFIGVTFALTVSGCMFLYASIYKHYTLWPLVSSLFLYNGILLLGFVNYLFGVGLLLWSVGLWIRVERIKPWFRFVIGTMASTALFFSHLMSVGLYAIIVAGYELQRNMVTFRHSKKTAAANLTVGASIFLLPLLLFLLSSTSGEAGTETVYAQPYFWRKIEALKSLLSGYQAVNVAQIFLIALFLIVVILHGKLRIAKPMHLGFTMLAVTYLLIPAQALSGGFVDYRLPVAIAFLAIGSTKLELRSQAWHRATLIGMGGVLLLISIMMSYSWHRDHRVIEEYRRAFSGIDSNAVLFVATGDTSFGDTIRRLGRKAPVRHLGSLATNEQGVFVPAIYAHQSQQPITVHEKFALIKQFQKEGPIHIRTVAELELVVETIRRLTNNNFLKENAVYLLIHDPVYPSPDHTQVIAEGSRFILLKLERSP